MKARQSHYDNAVTPESRASVHILSHLYRRVQKTHLRFPALLMALSHWIRYEYPNTTTGIS